MSFVAFEGVSMRYGSGAATVQALDDISLSFARGDFICMVGPSGCGKTTLLQTLAGFLPPSTGQVVVEGSKIEGPGPDRGVVFQQPALFPWMNVAGNAGFGPMVLGADRGERERRVEHWLRLVGLWEAEFGGVCLKSNNRQTTFRSAIGTSMEGTGQ